jgi:hypothetical protein
MKGLYYNHIYSLFVLGDISAVFTYLWKGESLAQKVDNGTRVIMNIGVGSFCSRPYSSINR